MVDFLGLIISGSESFFRTRDSSSLCNSSRVVHSQFATPLARMGIKQLNCVALLDFPNVSRPNESNLESHFAALDAHKMILDVSFRM